MIKILQFGLSYNEGGIETVALKILNKIDRTKFQIDFLIMGDKIAYEEEFKSLGSHIYKLPVCNRQPFKRMKLFADFFKSHKGEYDVIHCSYCALYSIEPIIFSRLYGVPKIIVHSRQSDHIIKTKFNILRHKINRNLIDFFATDYISCSKVAAEFMFSPKRYRSQNYKIIFNPVSYEKYIYSDESRIKIRKECNSEDSFVVGHIGVFLPFKNHRFVIEVFREICKTKKGAKLFLIGSGDDTAILDIKQLVAKYELESKVLFLGIVSNVEEYLSAMDVFLFPSLSEGFPNVVIEAQTSGVKCVISDKITKEVAFDKERVKYLSLDLPPKVWADEIINTAISSRQIDTQLFSKLEIDQIVEQYEELYSV